MVDGSKSKLRRPAIRYVDALAYPYGYAKSLLAFKIITRIALRDIKFYSHKLY